MALEKEKNDADVEQDLLKEKNLSENNAKSDQTNDGYFILFCALTVNSFAFLNGCGYAWTSPVLLKLYSNDTSINPLGQPITKFQESVIAGIPFLGSLIGPFFLSVLANNLGRKKVLILFGGTELMSFVLFTIDSVYVYYLARFLFGLGFGIVIPTITIYITEISPAHKRGRYGSLIGMFIPIGNLCSFVVGPLFSVRMFSLICSFPFIIIFPLFVWLVPDSPNFLASKGKIQKTETVLKKLRGRDHVKEELEDVIVITKKQQNADKVNLKNLLNDKVSLLGLKIAMGVTILQIFSGIGIIMAFVGPIFQSVSKDISGNTVAILLGIVKLLSFGITATVIDRFNRKTLLMTSTIGCSICLFVLGLYFYLKDSKLVPNIHNFSLVPIASILLFVVFYAIGIGPMVHVILGEICPGRFKALCVAITQITFTILSFLSSFSFRYATFYLGSHSVFWLLSAGCCLGTFFVHFQIPETKGKSLLEIQRMLEKMIK